MAVHHLQAVEESLRELEFPGGLLISAGLGPGNKGAEYILRSARGPGSVFKRSSRRSRDGEGFEISPRDDAGMSRICETAELTSWSPRWNSRQTTS